MKCRTCGIEGHDSQGNKELCLTAVVARCERLEEEKVKLTTRLSGSEDAYLQAVRELEEVRKQYFMVSEQRDNFLQESSIEIEKRVTAERLISELDKDLQVLDGMLDAHGFPEAGKGTVRSVIASMLSKSSKREVSSPTWKSQCKCEGAFTRNGVCTRCGFPV